MAYEVIWTRLLGLIVGPTTYSFTIVLVSFITGLALGSIIFGFLADKIKSLFMLLVGTQIIAALSALFVSQLLGNSQLFFAKLIYTFKDDFVKLYLYKAVVLFVFLVLPTVFSGATFPLIGKIYTRAISGVGKSIGFAYTINTIGAVAGSFCAGFLLIPLLGKEKGLSLVIGLQLLTALAVTAVVIRNSPVKWKPVCLILPSVLGVVLCFFFPVWNHTMLATGKYHRFEEIEMYISTAGWLETILKPKIKPLYLDQNELVYYGDGIGGFTTVLKATDAFGNVNYLMANSGKVDASTGSLDMATQTLSAHFPMLFHPNPRTVMVLGLASGITAGEVLNYPVERLDVLEISPQVVKGSDFFKPWNYGVLSNPKTNLIVQDGRAHLYLTNQKYDVIISEPSNPWMAGMADLFTRDFFAQVHNRLNPDGVFTQFIHSYQMDWQTFALVCRTFADVFHNNLLVLTNPGVRTDYLLIGIKGDNKLNLSNTISKLPYLKKSKNVNMSHPRLLYPLIMSEDVGKLAGNGPLNTDDHPTLEFSAPQVMHLSDPSIVFNIQSNKFLTDETRRIISNFALDIDSEIDFAEYFFSLNTPLFKIVIIEKADAAQRERLYKIIENYCASHQVNFDSLPDDQLRRQIQAVQIKTLESKIHTLQNHAAYYYYLYGLYNQAGMADKATASLKSAIALKPDAGILYISYAKLMAQQGKIQESIDSYLKAVEIEPYNYEICNEIGILLNEQSKYDEAVKYFEKAIRLKSDFTDAYGNLGYALLNVRRYEEAIKYLSVSAELDGDKLLALGNFEKIVENENTTRGAAISYQKKEELKKSNACTFCNLGIAYAALAKYEKAIEAYKNAIAVEPNYVEAYYGIGINCGIIGKYEEEIEAYKEAIRIRPDYLDVYYSMSAVYAKLGQNQEALEVCKKALEIQPDNATSHQNLIILYFITGDKESGQKQYEVLKKLDPNAAEKLSGTISKYLDK